MYQLLLAAVFLVGAAHGASAVPFSFMAITGNDSASGGSPTNPQIGEAQLSVDVSDAGGGQALFTFTNVGPDASSITDIYFDDGSLLGVATIDNSDPGVQYSLGATPAHLPGGRSLPTPFEATTAFNTSSDPPPVHNGVNPGETLGITFDLQAGRVFQDVLDELESGLLRIGLKVQGFADGGSETFVSLPQPVPEPSTALALGTFAFVGFAFVHWRRQQG